MDRFEGAWPNSGCVFLPGEMSIVRECSCWWMGDGLAVALGGWCLGGQSGHVQAGGAGGGGGWGGRQCCPCGLPTSEKKGYKLNLWTKGTLVVVNRPPLLEFIFILLQSLSYTFPLPSLLSSNILPPDSPFDLRILHYPFFFVDTLPLDPDQRANHLNRSRIIFWVENNPFFLVPICRRNGVLSHLWLQD